MKQNEKRILMVPAPLKNPGDGVERFIHEISKRLSSHFDVSGLSVDDAPSLTSDKLSTYHFKTRAFQFPRFVHRWGLVNQIEALYNSRVALAKVLTREEKILIHTHATYAATVAGRHRRRNVRWVCTIHGFRGEDLRYEKGSLIRASVLNSVLRCVYGGADHYTVFSSGDAAALSRIYGVDHNKVSVVPLGVDAAFYSKPLRPQEAQRLEVRYSLNQPLRILFLGHADRSKHCPVLIDAFNEISLEFRDVMLILATRFGNGLYMIREKVRNSPFQKRIRIISDRLSESDLKTLQRLSDVFVNLYERKYAASTALIEAMAAGAAPIVLKGTAQADAIGPNAGLAVNQPSVIELTKALRLLLGDDGLRHRISNDAKALALREHDWQSVVVPRLIQVYERLEPE